MDINLKDFYEISKIELHLFTFEINDYKLHDISYLTHPNLSLVTAVQMSCALPILITPVCIEDKCYIDGGLTCNYPLHKCIETGKKAEEILGFKNNYGKDTNIISGDSTMLDFLLGFLFKAVFSLSTHNSQPCVKYEVICNTKYLTIDVLKSALINSEARKDLLNSGIESAKEFLSKLSSEEDKLKDSVQELS
jgi:predicted acylesterase/phospholipase RssA